MSYNISMSSEMEDTALKMVGLELMFLTPDKYSNTDGITAVELAKLVNLPAVTAYLVAGVLIGPFCLGLFGVEGLGFTKEVIENKTFSILSLAFASLPIDVPRRTHLHLGSASTRSAPMRRTSFSRTVLFTEKSLILQFSLNASLV